MLLTITLVDGIKLGCGRSARSREVSMILPFPLLIEICKAFQLFKVVLGEEDCNFPLPWHGCGLSGFYFCFEGNTIELKFATIYHLRV